MFFLCRNHFHRHSSPTHGIHETSIITLSTWFHGFHGFLTGHLLLSTYHKYLHVFIYQLIKLIQQISLRGTYFSPSIASIARKNSVSLILLIKKLMLLLFLCQKVDKNTRRHTWYVETYNFRHKNKRTQPLLFFCQKKTWRHKYF